MASKCPYDPTRDEGGMFHCPVCGEMVVAGLPHPDYDIPVDEREEDLVSTLEEEVEYYKKRVQELESELASWKKRWDKDVGFLLGQSPEASDDRKMA